MSDKVEAIGERAERQLVSLAGAVGLEASIPDARAILARLLGTSRSHPCGTPAYLSDVVDDHTPYEMSLALGNTAPEVRLLVETVDEDHSLAGRWQAARDAGRWLASEYGAHLDKLDRIADLFEPRTGDALLSMWHAIVFRQNGKPETKVYLDLRARGRVLAATTLEEALSRLDLSAAYPRLMREGCRRGAELDELVYFSLDLSAHETARVKVYFRHHQATATDMERVIGTFGGVNPGEVRSFCKAILGNEGPYLPRPLVSCWSFSGGATPSGATIYAPVAYYARDDREAQGRVRRWLGDVGLEAKRYDEAISAFAQRPLADGTGMHSYVSFKRDAGVPKVTCYLAPEANQTFAPGSLAERPVPAPHRPTKPTDLVAWYEQTEMCSDHPLFRRLQRETPAVGPLWAILANNWVGIGNHFPRWLAALVARVDDDRVRSILAKQLDDELGNGDPTKAHRVLFQRMLSDLEPFALPGDREALMAPGRTVAKGLARNYLEKPELEAIGGTLIAEVFGKQVDQAIGNLLRRQNQLDTESLTWLVMHETLEEDHANESMELASMIPDDPASHAAVCEGAKALATLGFRYFDDLYEVLFR